MKRVYYITITFLLCSVISNSQSVAINKDGSLAAPSSILDVKSKDQGVLFPRMSSTDRMGILTPVEGLMVWDTVFNSLWGYDGAAWREVSGLWERNGTGIQNINTGNVGIGASSTGASLYIKKNQPSIWFFDDSNESTAGTIEGIGKNLIAYSSRAYTPLITGQVPGHLILQIDEDLGMFGNYTAGNVGIGTETPAYKLSLNGDMGFYNGSTFIGRITDEGSNMAINARFGSILGSSPRHLLLQYNTGGLLSTVGNVGIGVNIPTAKLHVASNVMIGSGQPASGYLLSVNGRIMAEEMRVELDSGWPDYVFQNDYQLTTLDVLDEHIKELGHLPGIPSAADIQNEGILLGEMANKQMEKIEELTLYILQLHKRIEALETQNNK